MPNLGPAAITSIPQDLASRTLEAIRAGLHGRTQKKDLLGRIGEPTYEQQRQKNQALLKGFGSTTTPLSPSGGDWTIGGPSAPEVDTPEQRTDRGLFIYDLVTAEKIELNFVPTELDYNPNSNFESIEAMARNNPLYHYTGSEDTLKFNIDWYSKQDNREDVILNCKKIEALSKNDGFDNPPHRVKLIWNSLMFSEATWVVVAAPYKLSLFQAHRNMLPQQAYQEITLKRAIEINSSISQIRGVNF